MADKLTMSKTYFITTNYSCLNREARITYYDFNSREEAENFAQENKLKDYIISLKIDREKALKRTKEQKAIRQKKIKTFYEKYPSQYSIYNDKKPRDVTCDICNKSCWPNKHAMNIESAVLHGFWGFDSNKDCQEHTCNMCESCYDKVVDFINSLGGKIRILNYSNGDEELN